jgi:hypothetical protein
MTTTNLQFSPYLKTQWQFPYEDLRGLSNQVDIAYIDISSKVNARTIGTFSVNFPLVTGERWYTATPTNPQSNQPLQTLRQVYYFTSAGNIAHGINFAGINGFTRIYGTFYDGSIYYPLPYVDVTAANNQVNVVVNSTNIVITAGAGSPPTIVSGYVVLEWLSQF